MKTALKVFLITAGEGLVLLGCKFMYNHREIDPVFWLNMVVASIMYLVIILNMTRKINYFYFKVPKGEMGIFWTFSLFYILFAAGLIISGYSRLLSFNTLLLLHSLLLFFIFAGIYFSFSVNEYIIYYNKKKIHRDIIRQMYNHISLIENELSFKKVHNLKKEIHSIKKQVESIVPSDDPETIRRDENFVRKTAHILDILKNDFPNNYTILECKLNKCNKILKERKNIIC
ncbi:MAG: hypothetical protein LBP83_07610 [Dysgonamonadaceae bacterium]|jgi:hypothetical protein|nr:hypothetical protein [Dysgonamonadaceae bacterium]